ncbi:MAG: caspase family protein [Gemmatimonadota bacterium]
MVSLSLAAALSLIAGAGSAQDSGPGAELRKQLGQGHNARRATLAERRMMYTPLIKPNQFLEGELGAGDGLLQNGWILDEWSYQGRKNELVSFTVKASYDALVVVFIQQGTDRKELAESKIAKGQVMAELKLPLDGDYTVMVVGTEPTSRGPYTLTTKSKGSVTDMDYARLYPGGGDPSGRYALLVAADDYPGEDNDLGGGPSNDSQLMRQLLIEKYGFKPENIVMLKDVEANRDQIIEAFRRHLGQAGPNGVAVFHYSGHGMQMPDNRGWTGADDPEPDGKDEAIATWGTQGDLYGYILDDEMAVLTGELKAGHTLIVLDMCHAGTGTRGGPPTVRTWGSLAGKLAVPARFREDRNPPLAQARFIKFRDIAAQVQTPSRSLTDGRKAGTSEYEQPANHVLIAGSLADETSANYTIDMADGGHANVGLLTFMIFKAVMDGPATMTFSDLQTAIVEKTNSMSIDFRKSPQHPQFEGQHVGDPIARFLGATK